MKEAIWGMGVSTNFASGREEKTFAECRKLGIIAVEISPCYNSQGIQVAKNVFTELDFAKIKKCSKESGVDVWSYHLPFDNEQINPASLDAGVRAQTIELDKMMIGAVADLGAKIIVVHGSGEPIEDAERADSMEYAKESILSLAEKAKECGVTLAVENLPRTCLGKNSEETLELVKSNDAIKVCFDVNHLLCESHRDFVTNVGSKIATVHISDYDFINERHWVPGRGKINWDELVKLLMKVGYNGPFMNEVGFVFDDEIDGRVCISELKKANDLILCK